MPSFPTNDSNGAILGKVGDWLRATFVSSDGSIPTSSQSPTWLTTRIEEAEDGDVIDLHGRDITLSGALLLNAPVTLRNGTIRRVGGRVATVASAGVRFESMTFERTGTDSADGGAGVYVQAGGFASVDSHYSSTAASALVLQHGTCNRTRIVGGTATSYARKQNSAGIYVSAGNVGNYGIVIDGVTVAGGADRGPDGILVFDANGCVVRNCTVRNLRALPDVTIPQTWTLTATANVWESAVVRSDGPTRVILVNGTERAEETATPTAPAVNKWGISDGKVYLNSTVDPNTQTIVSRIVSGYGITLYCTAGAWRDMSRNVVAHNRVEDVDGFGIYLQLGDPVAVGNATDTNVLINTCQRGLQSGSLPFSALGVIGGKQTTLSNDLIDGSGVSGYTAPGIKVNWSNNAPTDPSTGQIIGARVRNATRSGVQINGGAWQLTNLNVTKCDNAGILLQPEGNDATINTVIANCEVSFCAWQGLSADSNSYTGAQVNVAVVGGYWRKNGSFGAMVRACRTVTIGAGAIFDANPSGGLHISTGNNTVHLDGVTFTNSHGLTVDNSVVKFTTGRLLWGVNVATKVQGTGAARVLDVFEVPTVKSPNGTLYKLAVSDAGALTTVAV